LVWSVVTGNMDAVEFFTSPDRWVAFLTLFVLEVVLGIDNVVFISILAGKLPPEQQRKARLVGLSLAMFLRIGLLFLASWIVGLTAPLFGIGSADALQFSGRDLILIIGGLFLIYKAVTEIHEKLEGHEGQKSAGGKAVTFSSVIVQILLLPPRRLAKLIQTGVDQQDAPAVTLNRACCAPYSHVAEGSTAVVAPLRRR
jgi:predicted tellurium resistance membrane protein TerC